MSAKINFGRISSGLLVGFKGFQNSNRETFRRWKIARKAWYTRKHGKHCQQLSLPL